MRREDHFDRIFPNFRDLGGFYNCDEKYVSQGVYFRSGMPAHLDKEEYAFLFKKGIQTVIDFRIDEEMTRSGWYREKKPGIDYIRLPYYDRDLVSLIRSMDDSNQYDWPQIYAGVLKDGREWIRRVFLALALSRPGVLFYCASGKDRTGVIAALLLDLLGAEKIWIYIDYALSRYSLKHNGSSFYRTTPDIMQNFLEILHSQYKDAENYLIQVGVPFNLLQQIRTKSML